ncbi:MAG: hypothetical protein F7C07_07540 [Desulfurococcales archaeon]|nr:hypothetical protein [Desulfurococcales archaeon]
MTIITLTLEALNPARPRWWGDFSPSARGPVTSASLGPTPIPLPSTLAGAIAAALGARPESCGDFKDPLECQTAALHSVGVLELRGPLLAVEVRGSVEPLVPWGSGFKDLEGNEYTVAAGERAGVALSRTSKSVLEGYLYFEELAWGVTSGNGGIKPYKLVVEVVVDNGFAAPSLVLLGGEKPAFKSDSLPRSLVEERLASLWEDGWEGEVHESVVAVATPTVLPEDTKPSPISLMESLENALNSLLSKMEPVKIEPIIRCTIAALGLGYDMARNLPRPYKPVLLPGCLFRVKTRSGFQPSRLYREGLGRYANLGWGTILPLPPSIGEKLSRSEE